MEFPKQYLPKDFEKDIYQLWEKKGVFEPQTGTTGKTFYIPIPPPNVTGNLHLGHALTLTLQDIMIRYHRMKGDSTLWVPGTDHAGIATQSVVEKRLAKDGKSRTQMGRETFLGEVWKWKEEYEANIINQTRLTGASLDWTKNQFTLSPELSQLVEYTFCNLYEKGLLYRGEYMINYSPALGTAISDMEVDYKEEDANLYHIIYFVSGSDKELIVATTRPETLLGDQALAVHPKDKRYKKLIGRKVILPIVNVEIPIIGDESVEMDFGTGVVKVTPAHDASDFAIAKRHDLNTAYQVIDKNGNMTKEAGIFAGLDFMTARENVVELLKAKGNLVKIEPYTHRVGYCSRSGCKVESIISTQWFVKTDKMAKRVLDGYKKKEFTIIPDRYGKVFEDWMKNLRDWCVSRQLWWGHQIPAYYHKDTGELLGVTQDPSALYAKYGQDSVVRDEDVLDTWFSSALWPFAILGWTPEDPKSELFSKFYPAQVLETGHDILPFWVVRMLLMGYEFTGQTPFKNVYLHGLVRDEQGRKMSKSLGNGIDPVEVINQFSADALRLSLAVGNTPGNNMNYSLKTTENHSLFLNKLWNIARFCHGHTGEITQSYDELAKTVKQNYNSLLPHEKWILSRLTHVSTRATQAFETLNFGETGGDLIFFTRDEFADFFVEEYKLTAETSPHGKAVLSYVLLSLLRLWHPFIPFVTEALYARFTSESLLALAAWPQELCPRDEKIEDEFNTLYDLIKGVRFIRGEFRVPPGQKVNVILVADKKSRAIVEASQIIFEGLAKVENLSFAENKSAIAADNYLYHTVCGVEIFVEKGQWQDKEEEARKLRSIIEDKKRYISMLDQKLTDGEFLKRAPEFIVRQEQDKKILAKKELTGLEEKLKALGE